MPWEEDNVLDAWKGYFGRMVGVLRSVWLSVGQLIMVERRHLSQNLEGWTHGLFMCEILAMC